MAETAAILAGERGWPERRSSEGARRSRATDLVAAWLERERPQWFNWLPVALGCGIAVYFALPAEPTLLAATAPLPAALLLWCVVRRGSLAAMLLGLVAVACLGLALAKLRSDAVAAPILERRMGPVEVRGVVELVEPRETRGERLTLRVTSIAGVAAEKTPGRVRIRTMSTPANGVVLKPGVAVRVKAHLAPPSAPVLPGGYDFARGAYFQSLGAIGYALSRAEIDTAAADQQGGGWQIAIARLRQDMSARVTAALPGQTGAIATALISGERGAISTATNDAYRDSGLYHVLSISGLHMAIMGGAVFFVVRILLALFPAVALHYPVKKWAAAAAILASLGYLAISGAAFATVRSAVTITIMFVAVILDRPAIAMRNVALSALLILLVWPESLTDVGFQMSFAAVVALVASYEALRRMLLGRARWPEGALAKLALFAAGIVLSTLIASVAVAPFGAYYFHKGQQLAIIANVVATPVINLVIMPAALAALVLMPLGLEAIPLAPMGLGIDLTTRVAEWVAALPGAATRIPAISALSFGVMIAGGLWLLLWRERPRWLGLVGIVAGLALAPMTPHPDILVGRDGHLVAARADAGRLVALAAPQTAFELSRWLEHDGDARPVKDAAAAAGFVCDPAGCVTRVRGYTLAAPRHPSAIADDCARADIVVLSVPRPKGCTGPAAVVDFFDLRAHGTHAIFLQAPPGDGRDARATRSTDRGGHIGTASAAAHEDGPADAPRPGEKAAMASHGTATAAEIETASSASAASVRRAGGEAAIERVIEPVRGTRSGDGHRAPGMRIETVASVRGDRPWSRLPWWAKPRDGLGPPAGRQKRESAVARAREDGPAGDSAANAEADMMPRPAHHPATPGRSRLAAFAATPEFLASQQIPRADAEIEDALKDPSLYDERW